MTVDLGHYTPEHRAELEGLLASPEWQEALASGLVEEVKAGRIKPGKRRDFIGTVVDQLLAFNEERVAQLIAQGQGDRDRTACAQHAWSDLGRQAD